jgi:hypothetical protein
MTLEQVGEMKPTYEKQMGHENIVLMPRVTFRLQAIKLLASLTYPLKITKVSPPCIPTCPTTYSSSTSDTASGLAGATGVGGT